MDGQVTHKVILWWGAIVRQQTGRW